MPLNEIANELNVAAILSGTIQKQGNKTRIIAELIEVVTKKGCGAMILNMRVKIFYPFSQK